MNKDLLRQAPEVKGMLIVTVTIGILITLVTVAQMTVLSKIVAHVFLGHQMLAQVEPLLFALSGLFVVRAGLIGVREVTAQRAALRLKMTLRARLFAHVLRLGPLYTRGERTGELVTSAVEGIDRLDAYVSRYLPQTALSVLVPLLIAAYILPLDWASGVLLLITGPIIPLLMIVVGSYTKEHVDRQWVSLSRLSARFLDAVQGLPTLIAFGRGADERERIAAAGEEFKDRTLGALRLAFLSGLVLELLSACAIALVAVTLGVRLIDGGISFETAFLVLLLAPEFYRPLRDLGTQRHVGMEGNAAATRIVEILRTPVATREGSLTVRRPSGQPTIMLDGVSYLYTDNPQPALAGVSLTLPAGMRTAIVGRSGAGKSTLVNLLLRFIDPGEGRITVNGIPIDDLPLAWWRAWVALVPQHPSLFYGSVCDNIRLARPAAPLSEVERTARLAGADEFIVRLPHGYDTTIGERGARLSAGQVQRIAIARAFLKDAPILILDEPTSSLDPESEMVVKEALSRLMHDRTVVIVAHRLNTVSAAEQIAVLDEGRLIEMGRHDELLARQGAYARLVGAHSAASLCEEAWI